MLYKFNNRFNLIPELFWKDEDFTVICGIQRLVVGMWCRAFISFRSIIYKGRFKSVKVVQRLKHMTP